MMPYTCYSDMCAEEIRCTECGHHYLKHGKKYDASDFSIELQEEFVYESRCCKCGSTEVEQ